MNTEEECHQRGREAHQAGRSMDRCPHYAPGEPGYLLRRAWRAGWLEENLRKLREVAKR